MLYQNVLSQIKRIQLSSFLPLNIISLVVLCLILFFTSTNIYAAQVSLAWDANSESDLAGYKVYYGNSSGSYDSNIDVGNKTSYTIQDLVEGQTYYVTVTAYDTSNNESGYSAEVVAVAILDPVPSTPTSFQATTISTSQINLSWNASSDDIGVTGYKIYRDSTLIATTSITTYPDTGLNSSTTYSYTVSAYDASFNESGQSSVSSATTLSLSVNNPPVLSPIGNKFVNEGQALSFTISATDPDGDTLSYTTNNLPSGASFNENTKTFAWTPTYNQAGTYSNITFQVSDGKDTDSESITITVNNVNRAPALNPIADITVNEGDTITLNPTATDPDGDTLTYTYSGWMTSSSYTTNYTDAGIHTVTVTVSDGTLSDSQIVTVTVDDINRPPVLDSISDITLNEGATITLSPTATDPDGDTLTYTYSGWMTSNSYTTNYNDSGTHAVTITVSDGSLSDSQVVTVTVGDINRPPVLDSISDITVNEGDTVTLSPTATDPDGDTLTFTYSGWMTSSSYTTNYTDAGTHTVTVTVSDGTLTDSQDVTVTVGDINRPPVLDSISDITVNEGDTVTLNPTATDPDGDTLTYTYSDWMTLSSYTTNSNDVGTHTVTVTVSDGTLTDSQVVTVNVLNSNSAPVLDPIADITVNEGDTITLNPTATDPDGEPLTYTYSGWMTSSSYTTNSNDVGTHTVTVTVSDGTLTDSQVVTVNVLNSNSAPVLDPITDITVNEGVAITLNPTATDPDGEPLTYTYSGWMTSSSYTTNYTDAGIHTVTVTVSDGTLTDSLDVIITVIDVDIISPSTPTTLQTTVVSSSQVDLSWSASTDNVEVTGYRIYRDGIKVADVPSTTYQDTGLSPLTTYVYTVSAYDAAGNESSQSTPVSATTQDTVTIFSNLDSYLGNASNWKPLTSSRWEVVSDGGSFRYGINATSYSNLSGDRLGEYSLIQGRTYGDFTFTARVKTTEDLSTNNSADYAIVFGYQDTNNYYYMMFNSNASFNQLFKIVNGSRQLIANATNLVTLDNAYHDVTLERTGTTVNVYFDNTLTLTATDSSFSNGQVGIGSYDDAPLWDDIVVIDVDTILPSTPTSLQATATFNTKMKLSWNASTDNVGVTGYRVYRDGIQVADVSSTTYQDTGLSKNTTYVYTISAYDAVGNESSKSTPLVSNTKSPGRPKGMKIVSS